MTVSATATVHEAAVDMMINYVHHLLVVDDAMHVIGLVSSFDLLGEVAEMVS